MRIQNPVLMSSLLGLETFPRLGRMVVPPSKHYQQDGTSKWMAKISVRQWHSVLYSPIENHRCFNTHDHRLTVELI
jgi:hypothetical protein